MKNKIKVISIVLFISALVMLISCKQQKAEWKGTIEEEDGVTIVKNPKEPMYGEDVFSLEKELTIGEKENGKEPVFISIRSVRVDDEENIHVLDMKASQVKVFNKDGTYLRNTGKRGQGPGEIQLAMNMELVSGREIMIYDLGNRKLIFFSLDGELLREVSTKRHVRLFYIIPDSKGRLTGVFVIYGEKAVQEIIKFDSNLETLFTVGQIELSRVPGVSKPYEPSLFFTVLNNDNVLWGDWSQYKLMVMDEGGEMTRKIIKDYNPIKITDEDREREIKEMYGDAGIPPDRKVEFPKYYPAFRSLSVDDEGRIFVRTFERDEEDYYYYDVFDSEGKYIAKIALKYPATFWKKNKLYTIEEDEDGLQMVKRYNVSWEY